jgi:hypothetical protein
MTGLLAIARIAFASTVRSHPLRALAALLLLAAAFAPSLVAFTFSGDDALAVAGAFGSAALLAPAAALFAGVALAAGESGGDGLAPMLRGPSAPVPVIAATSLGIAAGAIAFSLVAAAAGAIALSITGRDFHAARCAGSLLASSASAPAAAAAGLLVAVAAPRALASALAALIAAAALALPLGPGGAPPASVVLLARDAAFGELPPSAVLLSCTASAVAALALVAAGAAVLRAKDLAPRPGDA